MPHRPIRLKSGSVGYDLAQKNVDRRQFHSLGESPVGFHHKIFFRRTIHPASADSQSGFASLGRNYLKNIAPGTGIITVSMS